LRGVVAGEIVVIVIVVGIVVMAVFVLGAILMVRQRVALASARVVSFFNAGVWLGGAFWRGHGQRLVGVRASKGDVDGGGLAPKMWGQVAQ
jgi:hypothetical protein